MITKCKICFKDVKCRPSSNRKYCSNKCAHIDRLVPMPRCPICNKPKKTRSAKRCCSMKCRNKWMVKERTSNWRGGKFISSTGYVLIYVPKSERIGTSSYVLEHRINMEKFIGRKLKTKEHVHHINGNTLDNRIKNLLLVSPVEHRKIHHEEYREKYGGYSEFLKLNRSLKYKKG